MRFAGRMVVSRAFVAILFQVYLGTPRAAMHSPIAINVDFLWTVYLGSAGSLPAFIHPFNAWTVPLALIRDIVVFLPSKRSDIARKQWLSDPSRSMDNNPEDRRCHMDR